MLNRVGTARIAALALIGAAILAKADPALAQSSLGIGSAEPSIDTGGFFAGFFGWVNAQQQGFYRAMTGALGAMRDNPFNIAGLVGLSFAYGVFHAAGPGHGKAVISAYMVANEVALRRGVVLSFASALLQGAVAIVLVGFAYLILRGTAVSMTDATGTLEIASYAVITAFGAWLLARKFLAIRAQSAIDVSAAPAFANAHGHGHGYGHDNHGHDHHGRDHHHHGHDHAHDHACSVCGHSHAPDPSLLQAQSLTTREAWSAVTAVGLRPCSGALIVMTFAVLNGLYLGGILSVIAMSLGTAITVSALASMAVGAKGAAIRYSGAAGAVRITTAIEIFGAICVFAIGLLLLTAALSA